MSGREFITQQFNLVVARVTRSEGMTIVALTIIYTSLMLKCNTRPACIGIGVSLRMPDGYLGLDLDLGLPMERPNHVRSPYGLHRVGLGPVALTAGRWRRAGAVES